MSQTQSAHVCTGKQLRVIHKTGDSQFLLPATGDRCFAVIEEVAPSDVPPPGAPGQLALILPRAADTRSNQYTSHNHLHLFDMNGYPAFLATRHPDPWFVKYVNRPPHLWHCTEHRRDADGNEWTRDLHACINDHGWLVEVPTC